MDIVSLIIQLISGAVGGNIAGALMKKFSLGTAGNSIVGILGGGIGGTILNAVFSSGAAAAGDGIIGNIAGGGIGGAILLIIIGIIKGLVARK